MKKEKDFFILGYFISRFFEGLISLVEKYIFVFKSILMCNRVVWLYVGWDVKYIFGRISWKRSTFEK